MKDTGMGMIDWVLCACVDGALEMAVGLKDLLEMSRGSFCRKGTGAVLGTSGVRRTMWGAEERQLTFFEDLLCARHCPNVSSVS